MNEGSNFWGNLNNTLSGVIGAFGTSGGGISQILGAWLSGGQSVTAAAQAQSTAMASVGKAFVWVIGILMGLFLIGQMRKRRWFK